MAAVIHDPWVAMGDDGSVLIEDDLVLLGPALVAITTPWDRVRYFSFHDIAELGGGLGRQSFENAGGAWTADAMGFWVELPWVIGTKNFRLDYSWMDLGGGFGRNKHGMGWWPEGETGGGGFGTQPGSGQIACWDPAVGGGYRFEVDGSMKTKTSVVSPASPVNVLTWRSIERVGDEWTIKDGPSAPADGTLGEAKWTAPGVSVSAYPGIVMAGTHRVFEMLWLLRG
jgi:hypothetical protein